MSRSAQKNTPATSPQLSFLDFMDEGRITDWLSMHAKNIIFGIAATLAIIVAIFTFSSRQTSKAEQEYLQAASDFALFTKAVEVQHGPAVKEAYERLQTLMSKHPELHAAYDGALGQTFLNRNELDAARPYVKATLARTASDALPLYAQFANTTLVIGEKNYSQALKEAIALQQTMNDEVAQIPQTADRSFGDELFALNLLRIAILQQEQGDRAGELKTWQEWKGYAGLDKGDSNSLKISPVAFRYAIQQLAVGSVSLPDYIAHREKELKQ